MIYSPVATIDGIEFHPQASNVGIVDTRDKFIETIRDRSELSGTICRRATKRQEYLDVFNNVAGVRDLVKGFPLLYATLPDGIDGDIAYSFRNPLSHKPISINDNPLADFFNNAPFAKEDIDFSIRQLWAKGKIYINVKFLNDNNLDFHLIKSITQSMHADSEETYYLQFGGAGFEFTNAIPSHEINFIEGSLTINKDLEDQLLPIEIGALKAGDLMHFHGIDTGIPLIHRAPSQNSVKSNHGRFAALIF